MIKSLRRLYYSKRAYGPLMLPEEIRPLAKLAQERRRVRTPQESDLDELIADIPGGFIAWEELWTSIGLGITRG